MDSHDVTAHTVASAGRPTRPRNQAGRPTASDLNRRKAKVIEVATEMFATHGYMGTSLVDVAHKAGVATRTLYQHFGDKEALLREVIFARDTGGFFQRPVIDPNASLEAALLQTARHIVEVTYRQRSIDLMQLMIAESKRFPELTRKVAIATFSRFRRSVAAVFDELAERGHITREDHAESAAFFIDLMLGSTPIMAYTGWEPELPSDDALRAKVDMFVRGRLTRIS